MAEKSFRPLSSPQKVPAYPKHARSIKINKYYGAIRDNFTISTWLLIGGLFQGMAVALLGYLTLLPAAAVIAYRVGDNLVMARGWKRNRYLSGSNHPLGLFDPVYRKVSDYFATLVSDLEDTAEESGLLGRTSWVGNRETAANEFMTVTYFRDFESLHKYAHGPLHMKAVKYWSSIVKDTPHVSIFHETYVVPKGQWENIYVNSKPTGLSAAAFPVRSAQGNGETEWMSPIVDARHANLRTAAGRIQADYLKGYGEKQSESWNQANEADYGNLAP
ncbi:hypothetical protein EMCG_06666 [[Emmonsia] crescens]|uniref:Uncharacterized protein n=1 Tax=[Emmonsia] crescens TaxID=73230 RepID=A0A0G2JBJ8_9EURO|nr:hypothetical protein EMCG_06666 [Emmonsia crescens UAMH 3008]